MFLEKNRNICIVKIFVLYKINNIYINNKIYNIIIYIYIYNNKKICFLKKKNVYLQYLKSLLKKYI